jgi:hypothetical protein
MHQIPVYVVLGDDAWLQGLKTGINNPSADQRKSVLATSDMRAAPLVRNIRSAAANCAGHETGETIIQEEYQNSKSLFIYK